MSLLNQQGVAVNSVKDQITMFYNNTVQQMASIFNAIWNDPNNTPQQIVSGFGTDAALLFSALDTLQNLAKAINPSYVILVPPTGYTVTINNDGTVTITQP